MPFLRSPNQSQGFRPEGILLHDTAGRLSRGSSVGWFLKRQARASAHLVVERDGSVTQQVSFDRKAWHAGRSRYKGKTNVNAFAFGIEIVNLGRCVKRRDGSMQPWFKASYKDGVDGLSFAFASSKSHGKGWWLDYTAAQVSTVTQLCQALVEKYDLAFVAGHWEVSPGRKIDPNPLFPLETMRQSLFGEQEGADGSKVVADSNMRRWPSYNDNIITVLGKGTKVNIIRSGSYNNLGFPEQWHLVEAGDQQGWVHGSLIEEC